MPICIDKKEKKIIQKPVTKKPLLDNNNKLIEWNQYRNTKNAYFKCAILRRPKEIYEYERALYKAYKDDPDNWMIQHYTVSIRHGMRPKDINYTDQVIYASLDAAGRIIAGMTAHINPKNQFICEQMGFKVSKDNKTCEGLTMFVNKEYREHSQEILFTLSDLVIANLKLRGFKRCYGTTHRKYLNLHEFIFGWDFIAMLQVEKEERCLLKYEIND